jgi:hypothetical protein
MAVTTAQLKITSDADSLTSSAIAIDETFTFFDAGTSTGMTETTGLARKSFAASTETLLVKASEYTNDKATKLYIKNTDAAGASATTVKITFGTIGGSGLGILHNNEWALIPWTATSDLNVVCSSASTLVEWMVIFE